VHQNDPAGLSAGFLRSRIHFVGKQLHHVDALALVGILAVGIFLRTYQFPAIPPGLNQDEAGAGYEAFSLLLTGRDKWGNVWPVYFPAWGSGQNVLYSYLTIPWISLLGLNEVSVRIVSLLFGILTLPLLYVTAKRLYGRSVALVSTWLLAILPWHVMLSRWGLESNLLPFLLLLGSYTVTQWLLSRSSALLSPLALVPWALALYAYGTAYIIVPGMILLALIGGRKSVTSNPSKWLGALVILAILSFPIVIFVLNNYVLQASPGWENILGFSAPRLPSQRFNQVALPFPQMLNGNLTFLLNGFQDFQIWNADPYFPPLSVAFFPFLLVGAAVLARKFLAPDSDSENRNRNRNLFLLWLLACLPLVLLTPLNITRANALFIPVIVLSALGLTEIREALTFPFLRHAITWAAAVWILAYAALFAYNYFEFYPDRAAVAFQSGLRTALEKGQALATPSEKFYMTGQVPIPYNYVLFFLKIPPQEFQTKSRYTIDKKGSYIVEQFGRYYFDFNAMALKPDESFVYVLRAQEEDMCSNPEHSYVTKFWKVGRCIYEPDAAH
jgi:4-amino-4-deoxy-L-arabinose transferase-like glycosyltransferase